MINIWTVEKGYDGRAPLLLFFAEIRNQELDVTQNTACPALTSRCFDITVSPAWKAHQQSLAPLYQTLAQSFGVSVDDLPDIFLVLEQLRALDAGAYLFASSFFVVV